MATQSAPVQLGSDLPSFSLKAVDGKTYSHSDFSDVEVLVVGITCNHCPYVKAYEDRISELASFFSNRSVKILCVNSNDSEKYPEDSYEAMQKRAREKNFQFLYLRDEDQSFARSIEAACTPEFYVYDANRQLCYHGRLDDHQDVAQVKKHFLREVITALLDRVPVPFQQTPALGCSIKWRS
jgi:peroxiredoxin